MSLSQAQIDAINSMNKEFQNFQIGTLLGQALNGDLPADAIQTVEIQDDQVTTAKILDANVTNAKLATDAKVGSLAALTTTAKTSCCAPSSRTSGERRPTACRCRRALKC